jgi:hypothetical protein
MPKWIYNATFGILLSWRWQAHAVPACAPSRRNHDPLLGMTRGLPHEGSSDRYLQKTLTLRCDVACRSILVPVCENMPSLIAWPVN